MHMWHYIRLTQCGPNPEMFAAQNTGRYGGYLGHFDELHRGCAELWCWN